MKRAEQGRAAALARKDAPSKKARKAPSDVETSSDSDVEKAAAAEARKKKKGNSSGHCRTTRPWTASLQMQKQSKKLNWLSWLPFAIHTR